MSQPLGLSRLLLKPPLAAKFNLVLSLDYCHSVVVFHLFSSALCSIFLVTHPHYLSLAMQSVKLLFNSLLVLLAPFHPLYRL